MVVLSLDVSRCVGDIRKTNVNTTKMCVCDIGGRNVFEAYAFGGAGDLVFAMHLSQNNSFDYFEGWICD